MDRLQLLQTKIASSLKPKSEELRSLVQDRESKQAMLEFLNNEDIDKLYIFFTEGHKKLEASIGPPRGSLGKSMVFYKVVPGVKVTTQNFDQDVLFMDYTENPLDQISLITREIYMPILCSNAMNSLSGGQIGPERMMELLNRTLNLVDIGRWHSKDRVILPLPQMEVIENAASDPNQLPAVIHSLETTIISWSKQMKSVIRHDQTKEVLVEFGPNPLPEQESQVWNRQLDRLESIQKQLNSEDHQKVIRFLSEANSQYAISILSIKDEIDQLIQTMESNLEFWKQIMNQVEKFHEADNPNEMIRFFPPTINTALLVWQYSTHYHDQRNFNHVLNLLANEVVAKALSIVGEQLLEEPLKSYEKLKKALRVCAAFRGTYLDWKNKADEINEQNINDAKENMIKKPRKGKLFSSKMYGPHAYVPDYSSAQAAQGDLTQDNPLWANSPWPPRNAPCFGYLNSFMERCNDVLELVQTTEHFRLLEETTYIGGAGDHTLNVLVEEILEKYKRATQVFFGKVDNILDLKVPTFERAFFDLRMVVRELERKLSEILREAFKKCPTIQSQLRLINVFKGVCNRDLVAELTAKERSQLLDMMTEEVGDTDQIFNGLKDNPPNLRNSPPFASTLVWANGLKKRVQDPFNQLSTIYPLALQGDEGWTLRHVYTDFNKKIDVYINLKIKEWEDRISEDLIQKLKEPLFMCNFAEDSEHRPGSISANLDSELITAVSEIKYLKNVELLHKLPEHARKLAQSVDIGYLKSMVNKVDLVATKYNKIISTITDYELPLFESKMEEIDELVEKGLNEYTWRDSESNDFIEKLISLVCLDVDENLELLHIKSAKIDEISKLWSSLDLDVFSTFDSNEPLTMEELDTKQTSLNEHTTDVIIPSGKKIQNLLENSLEALKISTASPAWQQYADFIDAIVLHGLKSATITSLEAIVKQMEDSSQEQQSILKIRLEMVNDDIHFRPPVDGRSWFTSVEEYVNQWTRAIVEKRSDFTRLSDTGTFYEFIQWDLQIIDQLDTIINQVDSNCTQCKELREPFEQYNFLWMDDIFAVFRRFLKGRAPSPSTSPSSRKGASSAVSDRSLRSPSLKSPIIRRTPEPEPDPDSTKPTLADFDAEITKYKETRDQILSIPDEQKLGWIVIDMKPIKQFLAFAAARSTWVFSKYLLEEVSSKLEQFDSFINKTEPEVEGITGEEKDTSSFMRLMRLFNKISAEQNEYDDSFPTIRDTVELLNKYEQELPPYAQELYNSTPTRWNNLKTKVSLAKQKLGPRIQEQAQRITSDLEEFGRRFDKLEEQINESDVFLNSCNTLNALSKLADFDKSLTIFENEAEDLCELQLLLESSVFDFDQIQQCRWRLTILNDLWNHTKKIRLAHHEWRQIKWSKINIHIIAEELERQLYKIDQLDEISNKWHIWNGVRISIVSMQIALPLVDNLRNPAMRMRHWKQVVRTTGTTQLFDSDFLKSMTFGQLLDLDITKHVEEIRSIIAQAIRDLKMEKSLKFYEEVWLSKIFEFRKHARIQIEHPQIRSQEQGSVLEGTRSDTSQSEDTSNTRAGSRIKSSSGTPTKFSRQLQFFQRRSSDMSLPYSLAQLDMAQLATPLMLLTNTDTILNELESHQLALHIMADSGTAGSFLDDISKWQNRLQTIESVLKVWLKVQEKWALLEEVYNSSEARANLTIESSRFSVVNRDFRTMMKATEKNPNILQCCSRKYISEILQRMDSVLEQCHESLLLRISRYRSIFPRFYFLPIADIFTIICLGYDLDAVSPHLYKLIPNLNRLLFERVDDSSDTFQVLGVTSFLDEELMFEQPLIVENSIEIWLGNLLVAIKKALQNQLAVASGQRNATHFREISAVGARKATLSSRVKRKKSDRGRQKGESKSWLLDNNSQIVDLVTRIQATDLTNHALKESADGKPNAIAAAEKKCNNVIHRLTITLKKPQEKLDDTQDDAKRSESRSTKGDEESSMSRSKSKKGSSAHGSSVDPGARPDAIPESEQLQTDPLLSEAKTQEPVDTMTINAPSLKTDEEVQKQEIPDEDVNLSLFPEQIQKISRVISILMSQRELLSDLKDDEMTSRQVTRDFCWKSQLQFTLNEDQSGVDIHCLTSKFQYEFEYQGSMDVQTICYQNSRTIISLLQAVFSHTPVLCSGDIGSGRMATILQLASVLGEHCFQFNCSESMSDELVNNILRGFAISGCWICLESLYRLKKNALETFSNVLKIIYAGLNESKQSVTIGKDEAMISSKGALFTVMHSNVRMNRDIFDEKLIIPSCVQRLPPNITSQFRRVIHRPLDPKYLFEIGLTMQGFEKAAHLAHKITKIIQLLTELYGFVRPSDMSLDVGYGWTSLVGIGMTTAKSLSHKAGDALEDLRRHCEEPLENGEEKAIAIALRDCICVRLNKKETRLFEIILKDEFPNVEIPTSHVTSPASHVISQETDTTTEVHTFTKQILTGTIIDVPTGKEQTLTTLTDAVALATSEMSLIPCFGFQSRIIQLCELSRTFQTIIVSGPVGCGKSECIKTFASTEKLLGKDIYISSIYTRAVDYKSLVGSYDSRMQWRDGLISVNLRKLYSSLSNNMSKRPASSLLMFDGEITPQQLEFVEALIHNNGDFVLASNKRLQIPSEVKFLWEIESISHLNPTILSSSGLVVMGHDDVGWKALLERWLRGLPETDREIIQSHEIYMEASLDHLEKCLQPKALRLSKFLSYPEYKAVVSLNRVNIVQTLKKLMEGLVVKSGNVSDEELCRYFSFSCIWALGSSLDVESKQLFSDWWQAQFAGVTKFPKNGSIFDYCVDAESKEFVNWSDTIPLYTAKPYMGIASDAFIHTAHTVQLSYLFALLADVGRHCMFVGPSGCGKSGMIMDKIRTTMTGEVSEVVPVVIKSNNFTDLHLVHKRLSDQLEWKHGQTHVPRGNKKLVCFIDDLNLVQRDEDGHRIVCEMVREHIDDGGFYSPDTLEWKQINNVTYVSTVNPQTSNDVPFLQDRLLRHFSLFHVPYPSENEQYSIFKLLLRTHFIGSQSSGTTSDITKMLSADEMKLEKIKVESLEGSIETLIKITIDLKGRLQAMFMPTLFRSHYLFTMREVSNIFRNLTLTLGKGCEETDLLLLWQHECEWVFGQKLVDHVDYGRFKDGFEISIKKFIEDESTLDILLSSTQEKPVFGNLVERESGLVSAFDPSTVKEKKWVPDEYQTYETFEEAQYTCAESLREYNKSNPPISLNMYRSTVEQICRFSRVILTSHAFLIGSRAVPITYLIGSVTGYKVVTLNSLARASSTVKQKEMMIADLTQIYANAGVRGEKMILMVRDRDLAFLDGLCFLTDFVVDANSVRHLFSYEERTTIINSIRTEVTQAGLDYTKDTAWQFFLDMVRQNVRIVFICSTDGNKCAQICRDYPSLVRNMNLAWLGHWCKRELIDHSMLILDRLTWMNDEEKENSAHLLASLHLSVRQQDTNEFQQGFGHVTNTTFEKFAEKFVKIANQRHDYTEHWRTTVVETLKHIELENETATKLEIQLEHEKVVLEDRISSTDRMLAQIGQDRVIAQQQEKTVKQQLHRLRKLKKLLPEYQVAHERAVYKTANIVQDTQQIIKSIGIDKLAELRAMQKPGNEIEDLMSAIIMILKSPSADLSWQKGAKRQLANLERFVDELLSFDNQQLPESTLSICEPLLKKESFDPEHLQQTTANPACISLCRWVHNVVRYHRMMISKVRPLYEKVQETTKSIEDAEHKSKVLEVKKEAMVDRLRNLSVSFEEATLDKMLQRDNEKRIVSSMETAGQLKQILSGERLRLQQIFNSLPMCLNAIVGGCSLAAGLCVYLGPYDHDFRFNMLSVYWPNCLRERGIPLVIDSIDSLKGRVVEFTLDSVQRPSAVGVKAEDVDYMAFEGEGVKTQNINLREQVILEEEDLEVGEKEQGEPRPDESGPENATKEDDSFWKASSDEKDQNEDQEKPESKKTPSILEIVDEESTYPTTPANVGNNVITASKYRVYVRCLAKLLVEDNVVEQWSASDINTRQLENSAILVSANIRPCLVLDRDQQSLSWIKATIKEAFGQEVTIIDMNSIDAQMLLNIERHFINGDCILLDNCAHHIDNVMISLVYHFNNIGADGSGESNLIEFNNRRVICHKDFKLILRTTDHTLNFCPDIASSITVLNCRLGSEPLVEELTTRTVALLNPDLYEEYRKALSHLMEYRRALEDLMKFANDSFFVCEASQDGRHKVWKGEEDLNVVAECVHRKLNIAEKLSESESSIESAVTTFFQYQAIARRGAILFSIISSMRLIRPEYELRQKTLYEMYRRGLRVSRSGSAMMETQENPRQEKDSTTATESVLKSPQPVDKALEESNVSDSVFETAADDVPPTSKASTVNYHIPEIPNLERIRFNFPVLSNQDQAEHITQLTSVMYHTYRRSLTPKDRIIFGLLLCVNINVELGREEASTEEIQLVLKGFPDTRLDLDLSHFSETAEPPSWLPVEKWNKFLAISVFPGKLDNLCVHAAENSRKWKEWYLSNQPESVILPMEAKDNESQGNNLSDIQRLLLLQIIRPDRLVYAIDHYIYRHLNQLLEEEPKKFLITELMEQVRDYFGILLLVPPNEAEHTSYGKHSADHIKRMASELNISIIETNSALNPIEALGSAMTSFETMDEVWLLIENVSVLPSSELNKLALAWEKRTRERTQTLKKVIWMFAEIGGTSLPDNFLRNVYPVSWDIIGQIQTAPEEEWRDMETPNDTSAREDVDQDEEPDAAEEEDTTAPEAKSIKSQSGVSFADEPFQQASERELAVKITLVLSSMPSSFWEDVGDLPHAGKMAIYGLAILVGITAAKQEYGCPNVANHERWDTHVFYELLEVLRTLGESMKSDDLIQFISQQLLRNRTGNELDTKYVQSLCHTIMKQILTAEGENITVGSTSIWVPKNSVLPKEYPSFFNNRARLKYDSKLFSPSASLVSHEMQTRLFSKQLKTAYDGLIKNSLYQEDRPDMVVSTIKAAMDRCQEKLPPLLKMDPIVDTTGAFTFPYHRPSTTSEIDSTGDQMPHSLAFMLKEECIYYNNHIARIRQHLFDLKALMTKSFPLLPRNLFKIASQLNKGRVPSHWLPVNHQPSTHSLESWLLYTRKCYEQLHHWIRNGLIPHESEGETARGSLGNVWLGGLVNPSGLVAVYKYEYCMQHDLKPETLKFKCRPKEEEEISREKLALSGCYAMNAAWDRKEKRLSLAKSKLLYRLPTFTLEPAEDNETFQQIPVCVNISRQKPVMYVQMQCSPEQPWNIIAPVIILDPGQWHYSLVYPAIPDSRTETATLTAASRSSRHISASRKSVKSAITVKSQSVQSEQNCGGVLPEDLQLQREEDMSVKEARLGSPLERDDGTPVSLRDFAERSRLKKTRIGATPPHRQVTISVSSSKESARMSKESSRENKTIDEATKAIYTEKPSSAHMKRDSGKKSPSRKKATSPVKSEPKRKPNVEGAEQKANMKQAASSGRSRKSVGSPGKSRKLATSPHKMEPKRKPTVDPKAKEIVKTPVKSNPKKTKKRSSKKKEETTEQEKVESGPAETRLLETIISEPKDKQDEPDISADNRELINGVEGEESGGDANKSVEISDQIQEKKKSEEDIKAESVNENEQPTDMVEEAKIKEQNHIQDDQDLEEEHNEKEADLVSYHSAPNKPPTPSMQSHLPVEESDPEWENISRN